MTRISADSGLLETIQSLKGEELTSAVLGYLLARSPNCYRAFLASLGIEPDDKELTPAGVLSEVETHWIVDGVDIPGRLDLLVDTGKRLIGVENKIWASFMDDQPAKYCATLIEKSQKLGRQDNPIIVILAPKAKRPYVLDALRQVEEIPAFSGIRLQSVFWTDLLNRLGAIHHESDLVAMLYAELKSYVNQRIWFPSYKRAYSGLRAWDGNWNSWQQKLVAYLWYVFPYPGPRLNSTNRWLGYPFFTDRDDVWGWFGFVRTETELRDYDRFARANPVEFVINYKRDGSEASDPGKKFADVSFDERSWREKGWLVDFDESWTTSLEWSDRLTDAIDAIGSVD